MIRLFVTQNLYPGLALELSLQQVHYLLHVMRVKPEDTLLVFNGQDGEWSAKVISVSKRNCCVEILSPTKPQAVEPDLTLLFPPLKPKPLAFLIEKCTEVGATHLQPILTERSTVRQFNEEKALAIAIEAAEQCGRLAVPSFGELKPLQTLLKSWEVTMTIAVGDETHNSPSLLSFQHEKLHTFMIGPEGGWSPQELDLFESTPFIKTVDLGQYILRAETAAVVGLATIQQIRRS